MPGEGGGLVLHELKLEAAATKDWSSPIRCLECDRGLSGTRLEQCRPRDVDIKGQVRSPSRGTGVPTRYLHFNKAV